MISSCLNYPVDNKTFFGTSFCPYHYQYRYAKCFEGKLRVSQFLIPVGKGGNSEKTKIFKNFCENNIPNFDSMSFGLYFELNLYYVVENRNMRRNRGAKIFTDFLTLSGKKSCRIAMEHGE